MGFAWDVTADVAEHTDALDWFGKRTVITAADARKIDDRLKVEAFWVGGGLHLHQVQRVFDKLDTAIRKGEDFESFRKRALTELRDPAHAETVFRNATQRAYNAGRHAQMTEPSTAKFRPFWMYDSILDSRTTQICTVCNGVILPHEHAWWDTHWPPQHHRCRASVRNLRRTEAEKRGVRAVPPGEAAPDGWGVSPAHAKPWKPDLTKVDAQLAFDFEAKAPLGEKTRKPRPAKEHKAKPWIEHYAARYGDEAAASLGEGRASYETGLDMTVAAARKLLRKVDAPGVVEMLDAIQDADDDRTLREQTGETDPLRKAAAALAGHLRRRKARAAWSHADLSGDRVGKKAERFYSAVTGAGVNLPTDVAGPDRWTVFRVGRGGACEPTSRAIAFDGVNGCLEHEIGHAVEFLNPELFERAKAFLKTRARGEKTKNHGQNGDCWDDGFQHWYTGRRYRNPDGSLRATEITSTGIELLFAAVADVGTLERLAIKDFEHLLFLLGQLKGT